MEPMTEWGPDYVDSSRTWTVRGGKIPPFALPSEARRLCRAGTSLEIRVGEVDVMSYVPATFTAGFALMLTAAGAIGGQWVSGIQQTTPDRASVKTEARSRTHVAAPATPARDAVLAALETAHAPASLEILELQDMHAFGVPTVPTLGAPRDESRLKTTPAMQVGKLRASPSKKK